MDFQLKQIIYIEKIKRKNTLVKELDIKEGDDLIITLIGDNTQYAREIVVYNPRTDMSKKTYLNIFLTSVCAFDYIQKY